MARSGLPRGPPGRYERRSSARCEARAHRGPRRSRRAGEEAKGAPTRGTFDGGTTRTQTIIRASFDLCGARGTSNRAGGRSRLRPSHHWLGGKVPSWASVLSLVLITVSSRGGQLRRFHSSSQPPLGGRRLACPALLRNFSRSSPPVVPSSPGGDISASRCTSVRDWLRRFEYRTSTAGVRCRR